MYVAPATTNKEEPAMMMHQTLTQLRTLKLDGFADGLEEQLTQPGAAALSFEERLSLLVDPEASRRDDRRRTRLLKQARLEVSAGRYRRSRHARWSRRGPTFAHELSSR